MVITDSTLDTTRVKIVLANEWGGDAVNISLTLESNDPRITILDNYIQFNDSPLGDIIIPPGEISSTVFDWFLMFDRFFCLEGPRRRILFCPLQVPVRPILDWCS